MKKNKLTIEKFRILELTNLSSIKGGTYTTITDDDHTTALNSENTTFTTDPNEVCPETIGSDGQTLTSFDPQNGSNIPTLPTNPIPLGP